ncbi:helix-turn-helix domain-containing protein [Flavobacteriaceae bacterium]|nr:helix-turn-helix domain-containing protein [Flavobacteriaceae bacterium]
MDQQKQIEELQKQVKELSLEVNVLKELVDKNTDDREIREERKELHKIRKRNLLMESALLSAEDVMEILQISKNTLTKYINDGALVPAGNARGMKRMFRKVDIKKSFAPELLTHYGSWDKVPDAFIK